MGLNVVTTREGILNAGDHGALVDLAAASTDPLGISGTFSDGNDGRLPATLGPELDGAFRTPTLRCVNKRPSFMHTGTVHSLEAVVDFFSRGGDTAGFEGKDSLSPVNLGPSEIGDLVAFLKALDGPGASVE